MAVVVIRVALAEENVPSRRRRAMSCHEATRGVPNGVWPSLPHSHGAGRPLFQLVHWLRGLKLTGLAGLVFYTALQAIQREVTSLDCLCLAHLHEGVVSKLRT